MDPSQSNSTPMDPLNATDSPPCTRHLSSLACLNSVCSDRLPSCSLWFLILDLKSGYWQVEMKPKDKEKMAFTTGIGLWQFKVLPFGLCNAPATFEHSMDRVSSMYLFPLFESGNGPSMSKAILSVGAPTLYWRIEVLVSWRDLSLRYINHSFGTSCECPGDTSLAFRTFECLPVVGERSFYFIILLR